MVRNVSLSILFVVGFLVGIYLGYFLNAPTIQEVLYQKTNPFGVPEQKYILISLAEIYAVDTKNKIISIHAPDPFDAAATRSLSATYDEKTLFVTNANIPVLPENLPLSRITAAIFTRESGNLHISTIQTR